MCKECYHWYGDNHLTFTGCQLGIIPPELNYYYLNNTLIKRKTGLKKKCYLFRPSKIKKKENNNGGV